MTGYTSAIVAAIASGALAVALAGLLRARQSAKVRRRLAKRAPEVPAGLWRELMTSAPMPVVLGGAAILGMLLVGVTFTVTALLIGVVMLRAGRAILQARSQRRYIAGIPVALDEMGRSLRSGAGILVALREGAAAARGQLQNDLSRVVRDIEHGAAIADSLRAWSARSTAAEVRLCSASLCLTLESGTDVARGIDGVAIAVRASLRAAAVAHTSAAQAKASAYVLTTLPLVVTGPLVIVNSAARQFLFDSALGRSTLVAGVTLDMLGAWWMSRSISRVHA